jgi:hypothetical protein
MCKRPRVPYAKGRKLCIFCGAPADSEEHIMPKWAHPLLPPATAHRRFAGVRRIESGIMSHDKFYRRQGPTYTMRIPRVCTICNNTWMSDFEQSVRPALERMILGKRTFLPLEMRERLARYLTYKMLLLDYLTEETVVPPEWAHSFYQTREIPDGVFIWLFNCIEGEWRSNIWTYGCCFARQDEAVPQSRNTKSFALGLGDLFVYAILTTKFDLNMKFDPLASEKLWPYEPKLMMWPPYRPIVSSDAARIAVTLARIPVRRTIIDEGA